MSLECDLLCELLLLVSSKPRAVVFATAAKLAANLAAAYSVSV
jgi:hypothetical protein